MNTTYNGWKNRSTWNVALWINNDEPLYRAAVAYMEQSEAHKSKKRSYRGFITWNGLFYDKTPDNIKYISTMLDYKALNEMMEELIS